MLLSDEFRQRLRAHSRRQRLGPAKILGFGLFEQGAHLVQRARSGLSRSALSVRALGKAGDAWKPRTARNRLGERCGLVLLVAGKWVVAEAVEQIGQQGI